MRWDHSLADKFHHAALHPDCATLLDALFAIFTATGLPQASLYRLTAHFRSLVNILPSLATNPPAQMTAAACCLVMQKAKAESLQAPGGKCDVAEALLTCGAWIDISHCIFAALSVSA